MMAAIEAGIITTSTKSRLIELENEKQQIEKGIAKELLEEPALEREQIIFFLNRFRAGDTSSDEYRTYIISREKIMDVRSEQGQINIANSHFLCMREIINSPHDNYSASVIPFYPL